MCENFEMVFVKILLSMYVHGRIWSHKHFIVILLMFFVAGEDYNGSPITVNVPAGVTMQPLTINIIDNNIVECNEMFNVTMVSVTTCGVTIGSNRISEVMIRDDDGKYRFFICSFCYIRE